MKRQDFEMTENIDDSSSSLSTFIRSHCTLGILLIETLILNDHRVSGEFELINGRATRLGNNLCTFFSRLIHSPFFHFLYFYWSSQSDTHYVKRIERLSINHFHGLLKSNCSSTWDWPISLISFRCCCVHTSLSFKSNEILTIVPVPERNGDFV